MYIWIFLCWCSLCAVVVSTELWWISDYMMTCHVVRCLPQFSIHHPSTQSTSTQEYPDVFWRYSRNAQTWRCSKKEEQYMEEGPKIIYIMYLQIILWTCTLGTLKSIGCKKYPSLIIVTVLKLSSHWHTLCKIIGNIYSIFCDVCLYNIMFISWYRSCHITVRNYCKFPHAGFARVKQI